MGKLFIIEGTDGSGKQTQFNRLCEKLRKDGVEFKTVSFPNYESETSTLVKMYLAGKFGENAKSINAYIASTFYAADRIATFKMEKLDEYYDNGGIILADRYTTSNMVHQAGKILNLEERQKFLDWLIDLEFNLYKLPKPSKVFFLNMPTEYAIKLMENRENKITHEAAKDIHEKDENHLRDSYNAACSLVDKYGWYEVKCIRDGNIRSIEDIHEEIYKVIKNEI